MKPFIALKRKGANCKSAGLLHLVVIRGKRYPILIITGKAAFLFILIVLLPEYVPV